MTKNIAIWCGLTLAFISPAWAGNGNMLHGFGPVNSSMGGAGAGLSVDDPIGTLAFNPALMSQTEGSQVSFAVEFFQDDPEIHATLNGGPSGTSNASTQLGILPAFGFTSASADSKWSFGFGLIAIAGFRTDWPEDPGSVLFDTPPGGFGRIYTDHRVTKIPLAVAFEVNDSLTLGLAVNGYVAELAIAPLPYEVTDVFNGTSFYPQGDGLVSEYAFSVQPSFLYTVNDQLTIGGSVTTDQDFNPFTWNSTIANPADPRFGKHRRLEYDLDGPLSATLGAGIKLNEKTKVAIDVTWIRYDGVSGFGSPGGIVDGVVQPFGWDNVWVQKIGVEHKVNDKLTLRAGYNHSDIPMPSENVLTATGAPGTFEHHFSLGAGYQMTENLTANLGFYYVPRSTLTGPWEDINNNRIGTLDTSNALTGVQLGLAWNF